MPKSTSFTRVTSALVCVVAVRLIEPSANMARITGNRRTVRAASMRW